MNPNAPPDPNVGRSREGPDGTVVRPTIPRFAAKCTLPCKPKLGLPPLVTKKYYPTQKEAEHSTSILVLAEAGGTSIVVLLLPVCGISSWFLCSNSHLCVEGASRI